MEASSKKKLWIFIAVAYGVTAIMTLFMIIGLKKGYDLTCFANAQMMYPACGVILGKLICRKENEPLPLAGYITVLVTTAVMIVINFCSLFIHTEPLVEGVPGSDVWSMLSSLVVMGGSIVAYIFFWVCGKEKRENAGLERKNIVWSIILVIVFILLFSARILISAVTADAAASTHESMEEIRTALTSMKTWLSFILLPINFFFVWIAFFGEEYGWRYYLQPIMQKKWGKRGGVLLLGLVWAVWHLGIDFMYYTTEYGLQAFVSQIITCVGIAIFFGYAYMKTQNIWVPVIMHYLNNNIAALLNGGEADALQNQVIPWSAIPFALLSSIVFMVFILMPIYNQSVKDPVTENSTTE